MAILGWGAFCGVRRVEEKGGNKTEQGKMLPGCWNPGGPSQLSNPEFRGDPSACWGISSTRLSHSGVGLFSQG